ncbi:hypothetical protein [Altibacter sp. HG106]|uniref:hypothetical protein n=1 Tax=Altibacter sp. HG106 TaxID=3023937 RepID=UPI00234FEBF2|nr:hypothetical protein [Altibacter sp. HG106]MDC7995913.1 hypothetical protein [Altibacter sp. HG106]
MIKKVLLLGMLAISLVSCQFTETMVLNEDGSGRMTVQMDLSEMMAFTQEFQKDSTLTKQDTIIPFKALFEEKKDSIAKLSAAQQARLKKMENYSAHLVTDPEEGTMILDIFVDFASVSEANNLMNGFSQAEGLVPKSGTNMSEDASEENEEEPEVLGVKYAFKNGVFKRDAFIKDKAAHKKQIDSLQSAKAFMEDISYTLKYTFPKAIKQSSAEDAMYSLDRKTVQITRKFIDYMTNPDVLDLEVVLEQ